MTTHPQQATETAAQPGHAFVVRGDLTKLACDAVVVPTSRALQVTQHWRAVVPVKAEPAHPDAWLDVDVAAPTGWGDGDRSLQVPQADALG